MFQCLLICLIRLIRLISPISPISPICLIGLISPIPPNNRRQPCRRSQQQHAKKGITRLAPAARAFLRGTGRLLCRRCGCADERTVAHTAAGGIHRRGSAAATRCFCLYQHTRRGRQPSFRNTRRGESLPGRTSVRHRLNADPDLRGPRTWRSARGPDARDVGRA